MDSKQIQSLIDAINAQDISERCKLDKIEYLQKVALLIEQEEIEPISKLTLLQIILRLKPYILALLFIAIALYLLI